MQIIVYLKTQTETDLFSWQADEFKYFGKQNKLYKANLPNVMDKNVFYF